MEWVAYCRNEIEIMKVLLKDYWAFKIDYRPCEVHDPEHIIRFTKDPAEAREAIAAWREWYAKNKDGKLLRGGR